ncbi:MAG: hypothetical protein Q8T09_09120 [Candidatus Melainabacteria bacterium]|nr:hypothetical protein [Candidatus Melainabacteria bacterium]
MGKQAALLVLILCVSTFSQVEASAKSRQAVNVISQKANTPSPFAVGNFFSASAAAAVKPSVEKRAGPKDAIGQALTDHNPTLEQVRLIPSLDGPQRKQVNDLFNVYRSDLKLLNEQLRPLREEFKARLKSEKEKFDKEKQDRDKLAKEKLSPEKLAKEKQEPIKAEPAKFVPAKEEEDAAIAVVVAKIKERQNQFTQALNKVVSPTQMLELEQLRRGKVPAYAQ